MVETCDHLIKKIGLRDMCFLRHKWATFSSRGPRHRRHHHHRHSHHRRRRHHHRYHHNPHRHLHHRRHRHLLRLLRWETCSGPGKVRLRGKMWRRWCPVRGSICHDIGLDDHGSPTQKPVKISKTALWPQNFLRLRPPLLFKLKRWTYLRDRRLV